MNETIYFKYPEINSKRNIEKRSKTEILIVKVKISRKIKEGESKYRSRLPTYRFEDVARM